MEVGEDSLYDAKKVLLNRIYIATGYCYVFLLLSNQYCNKRVTNETSTQNFTGSYFIHLINDIIPFTWLNLSMESFKLKCKKLLL